MLSVVLGLNYTIQRFIPVLTVGVHSFLPVLLGKLGVKIVWGYTKVNVHVLLGGNSACRGTHFPASNYNTGKAAVVGVHSFWPVTIGKRRVQGYTLSCLLVRRERRVQG